MREIDAIHFPDQIDVGDHQCRVFHLERQRGGLTVLTLQHLEVPIL
jgi:hypothetical protein